MMRYLLPSVFALTVCGAAVLLTLGARPGLIEGTALDNLFGFGWLVQSVLAFWFVLVLSLATADLVQWRAAKYRRWGLWSAVLLLTTAAFLWMRVPQRATLAVYRTEFQSFVDGLPDDGFRRWRLSRQIGPYFVDYYGKDRAGGVYFRTHSRPDGIGPDEMEYGFAFRPSRDGEPFGRSRHRLYHLFGDWYVFEGSSD